MNSSSDLIVFAWGKTGWHIFPIIALLEQKPTWISTLRIGGKWCLEQQVAQQYQIPFVGLNINNSLPSILRASLEVRKIFKKQPPKAVFVKGGYVSLPVLLAAKSMKIPIVAHESDYILGKTSRFASMLKAKLLCGFPGVSRQCRHVGQLLSNKLISGLNESLNNNVDIEVDNVDTQVDNSKTNIVVVGGSQWSRAIFNWLLNIFQNEDFDASRFAFKIIWWTSNQNFKSSFAKYDFVEFFGFVSQAQMGQIYDWADIAITRWWATSLFEQDLFELKKVIIPLPFASQDHQRYNALFFETQKQDFVVLEEVGWEFILKDILEQHTGYKKHATYTLDYLQTQIQTPKNLVWQTLLEKAK